MWSGVRSLYITRIVPLVTLDWLFPPTEVRPLLTEGWSRLVELAPLTAMLAGSIQANSTGWAFPTYCRCLFC
jgi:hypothetical protein